MTSTPDDVLHLLRQRGNGEQTVETGRHRRAGSHRPLQKQPSVHSMIDTSAVASFCHGIVHPSISCRSRQETRRPARAKPARATGPSMLKAKLSAGHQRPHQLVERRRQTIFALGQIRNPLRQLLIVGKSGKGSSKQVGDSCFVVGQD